MFCSECGSKVNDGAKFCFNCGTKILGINTEGENPSIIEKEIPEEFALFVERKYMESYMEGKNVTADVFYKKAKFFEVKEEQVDGIVHACEEKINKLEKFIASMYEECRLFDLTEDEEDEIIGFGNSLGFDDEDVEELMDYYDECNHIGEKQELYSECVLNYISDGKTHIKRGNKVQEYQETVYKLFEKNILQMESYLKEQYEKTKDYELSQEQVELIYSEGDKLFPEETIKGIIFSFDKKSGVLQFKEEKERQRALERMIIFNLYGEQVAYTEEEGVGISIGKEYRKIFQRLNKELETFQNNTDRTKEGYWDTANEKILRMIDTIYRALVADLEKRGVSEQDISRINYMDVFKYWIPVFEDIDYQYNMICCGTEAAEYYRKLRKETRGRLIGGGFGLDGAIKGIATAGAINLMTGAAHSAFNFVGNLKSEWKKLQAIKELFGYSLKENVEVVFKKTLLWAYLTELEMLKRYNISSKSFRLFYGENENVNIASVKSLKENPFNESIYEKIIMSLGIDAEIDKLAKFTDIDIREIKSRRKKKELEERTEDGIVFPSVADKEAYCKERDIYKPLLDEIKAINIWVEREKFTEKVDSLKEMKVPSVMQWKNERNSILKWCSEILKETETSKSVYLSEVLKVATSESWQETVVRQGQNNYNSLLDYFKGKINLEADERIALFIVSYKDKPNQALLFGNKHNYYVNGDEQIKFDFEQLYEIKYEIEKGLILNDKITCFEVVLLDGTIINLTSLFSSRGSSNYAIRNTFMQALKKCLEVAQNSYDKASDDAAKTLSKQALQKKYEIARNYEEGNGVEKNFELAIKLYEELADVGFADAQCHLAGYYYYGNGVAENTDKAKKLLELASNQGNLEATYLLAWMYSSVFDHHKKVDERTFDDKKAVELLLHAAEADNTKAQDALATHYYEGVGVEQNFEKAVYWARKAAEKGDDVAQYHLGCCYEYGAGITESKEMAVYWYSEAVKKGHKMAEKKLKALRKQGYKIESILSRNSNENDTEKKSLQSKDAKNNVDGYSNNVQEETKMFCPYCGEKILRTVKFCNFCGNEIKYKKKS